MSMLLQRLWIQLTADRKRFGILCAAAGVGLLLWARIIVISNVPRSAIAENEKTQARAPSPRPGAEGPSVDAQPLARVAVHLDETPLRDPFVISSRHFPKPAAPSQLRPEPAELPKSSPQSSEDAEEAKARQLAILAELVSRFRLEAVMASGSSDGGSPMAVINGRTWRLGESIPVADNEEIAFKLVQVRHRSVVLRFEEHLFELTMARTGGR